MKKLIFILAIVAFGISANAQSLNVQSAAQDMRKGYLNKAKASIDLACNHEQTKDDAKTWYYKGLIYCKIGDETKNPKSKYKDLAPDWCEQAYDAALRCKELDKDNEYAESNNTVFTYCAGEICNQATNAYNVEHDFAKALKLCDDAITAYGYTGDKKNSEYAYYLGGLCAQQLKDKETLKKYFSILMRRKTDNAKIYRTLFDLYRADSNNAEAMKVANNFYKFHPENYQSALMMGEAYMINGDMVKGNEMINTAVEKTKDNPQVYAQLLCASANLLSNNNDFAGAEARFNESLQIVPSQFEANFGMGSMMFNRAVDKINAANDVPFDDETGLADKLQEESKELFRQAEGYFTNAVQYIDALPAEQQAMQKPNLFNCLNALKTIYARTQNAEMLKATNTRLASFQTAQ